MFVWAKLPAGINSAEKFIDNILYDKSIFITPGTIFGSNGEVMNKTIPYLNQLAKFEEAVSYLKSKFGWSDDNPHAEEFLQLIKRRYL